MSRRIIAPFANVAMGNGNVLVTSVKPAKLSAIKTARHTLLERRLMKGVTHGKDRLCIHWKLLETNIQETHYF